MRQKIEFEMDTELMGKKTITVYEVSPEALLDELRGKGEVNAENVLGLMRHCVSLTFDELKKLYPSEKKIVLEKFKMANKDFFLLWPKVNELVKKIGLIDALVAISKEIKLMEIFQTYIMSLWNSSLKKD